MKSIYLFSSVLINIIIIGDNRVGKTSLVTRYIKDSFQEDLTPIGVDFRIKRTSLDGESFTMRIWELQGEERLRATLPFFFRRTQGVIIVFDKTNISSFERVPFWLEQTRRYIENQPIILIGNKEDDKKNFQVENHTAREFANLNGLKYIETSALSSYQVDLAFELIGRGALITKATSPIKKDNITVVPTRAQQIDACCLLL